MRIEIFPAESIAPYCKIEIAGAIGFTDSTPQLPTVVTLNVVKLRLRSRPETFKSAQQTKRRTNRGKRPETIRPETILIPSAFHALPSPCGLIRATAMLPVL